MQVIIIKSFNGIGDLLFVTPTLKKIKEVYPERKIIVNTNCPELIQDNPYVDEINNLNNGVFLGYPDPIHAKNPTMHHIQSDYLIVKKFYNLTRLPDYLNEDEIKPEIYCREKIGKINKIGVQVYHKGHWHKKKVWPYFDELIRTNQDLFEPIPACKNKKELVNKVAGYKAVVCAEGGISHIAKAVGIHAFVIYGGFANPEWNGYKDHNNICNVLPCSYCYNPFSCLSIKNKPFVERQCMKSISVEEVLGQIKRFEAVPKI